MKRILAFSIAVFSISSFAGIPYVVTPTNTPTLGMQLFSGGVGGVNYWDWSTNSAGGSTNSIYGGVFGTNVDTGQLVIDAQGNQVWYSTNASMFQLKDTSSNVWFSATSSNKVVTVNGSIIFATATFTNGTFINPIAGRGDGLTNASGFSFADTNLLTAGTNAIADYARTLSAAGTNEATRATTAGTVAMYAATYQLATNASGSEYSALGGCYQTNLSGDITLAAFSSVPNDKVWGLKIYAAASGADRKVTFPDGCVGDPGATLPIEFYVTNNAGAWFDVIGIGAQKTNVFWRPCQ